MPSASGAFPAGAGAGGPQVGSAALQQRLPSTRPSMDHPLSEFLGLSRSRNARSTTKSSVLGILPHLAPSTVGRRSRYSVLVYSSE